MVSPSSSRGSRFSEGLLIAITPALAYGIAYAYQAGFANYFGYPIGLIELSLKTVFIVAVALLGFGAFLWNIPRVIYLFRPPLKERERRREVPRDPFRLALVNRLIVIIVLLALFIPFPFLFGWRIETRTAAAMLGGFAALYALLVLLVPLVTERDTPYRKKIVTVERGEREDRGLDLLALDALERHVGPTGLLLVVVAVVIVAYAYFFGRSAAVNRDVFFVLSGEVPTVVLEFGDDKIIAAPFDAECRSLLGRYVIVPLSAQPVTIVKKSVGPLSPSCDD